MTAKAASQYMKRYGDYAFGTVTFLIVWFAVVRPEANGRRQDALDRIESDKQALKLAVRLEALVNRLTNEERKDSNNERRNDD